MDTPQQPTSQPNQQSPDEKLEFLKREEVRTMAKDIAKVREKAAKKEQERIANFKKGAKLPKKPQVVLSQQLEEKPKAISSGSAGAPPAPKKQEPLKRLTPRRPLKRSEKLFIRLVVGGIFVFLIFNAVAFGFWYFFKRETEPRLKPTSEQIEEPQVPPEQVLPEPTVVFFEAPKQELFLETPGELLEKLQVFLAGNPAPEFLNIVVKMQENILSRDQFLEGASLVIPQELREKLGENLMLFSYVAENKKRLGFLVQLKETENVPELLRSWEQSMEQDLASFFDIIGDKDSAYTPLFRSSVYQEIPVRFQTFSVIDFGIVYGVLNNKLLFTSSFESFLKTVDQLKAI